MSCLPIDCGTIMSSTAKQTESKIESMIQKAKGSAPCIVMLNHFEVRRLLIVSASVSVEFLL